MEKEYDVFICHASEDKKTLVTPIVNVLKAFGVTTWYDDSEIEPGSSIIESIDEGIIRSKFALVFITPDFLKKSWTKYERLSLTIKEIGKKKTVVIPILHDVSHEMLREISLYLADKKSIQSNLSNPTVTALKIIKIIRPDILNSFNEFFGKSQIEMPISGIKAFFPERQKIGQNWWDTFYSREKPPKEVLLMAQANSRPFNNTRLADNFVQWCNNEAEVKIIYLSPDNTELSQLHYIGKGMKHILSDDPNENLKKLIYNSIDDLEQNVISKISDVTKKPQVRYATRDLPFSLNVIDNEMVVTIYGTEAEGDRQPTIIIEDRDSEAYKRFKEEFFKIWNEHSKVYPFENPLITYFKKSWKEDQVKYIALRKFSENVPPPTQAILFPTYKCSANCSYCSFRQARESTKVDEMDLEKFQRVILELIDLGVHQIEISGGGEPLEHPQANDLMSCLLKIRQEKPSIKMGLITNGLHLQNYQPKMGLKIFNEYIRLSRCEKIEKKNSQAWTSWKNTIRALLEYKTRNPEIQTKLGIKYLLTPENKDKFVEMVEGDLDDNDISNLDYFRFTSDRRIDSNIAANIEQQIFYKIKSAQLPGINQSISLSLQKFVYPRNHRCWISPISVVIAPNFDVYMCCNYYPFDKRFKCLGNLITQDFNTIWKSDHHIQLRRKITRDNCNRECYCNCRFAEIQELSERFALTSL